jgi:hypothetical protein
VQAALAALATMANDPKWAGRVAEIWDYITDLEALILAQAQGTPGTNN